MVENGDMQPEEDVESAINAEYVSKFGDSEGASPLQVTSIPHKDLYRITRLVSGKFILISAEEIDKHLDGKGSKSVVKALKKIRKF